MLDQARASDKNEHFKTTAKLVPAVFERIRYLAGSRNCRNVENRREPVPVTSEEYHKAPIWILETRLFLDDTQQRPCAGTMLGRRCKRRSNIVPAQGLPEILSIRTDTTGTRYTVIYGTTLFSMCSARPCRRSPSARLSACPECSSSPSWW